MLAERPSACDNTGPTTASTDNPGRRRVSTWVLTFWSLLDHPVNGPDELAKAPDEGQLLDRLVKTLDLPLATASAPPR